MPAPSGAVRLRRATDRDVGAIVALWRACGLVMPWNDPYADIARCRQQRQAALFVATAGGALAGTVMAGDDGHRGWLYYVAVDPSRRRQGLGRLLVAHAEGWLRGRGVPKAELLVRAANREATGFYAALGYEKKPRVVMDRWLTEPPARKEPSKP